MQGRSSYHYPHLRWIGPVALLFLCLCLVPTAYADHTVAPTSLALVGSLQDELGCPGDWAPDCPNTELTSYVGSDGMIWRGEWSVPNGNWEYKVALNDSWDESYASAPICSGNKCLNQAVTGNV